MWQLLSCWESVRNDLVCTEGATGERERAAVDACYTAAARLRNLPSIKSLPWSEGEHDRALITQATLENKVKGVLMKY